MTANPGEAAGYMFTGIVCSVIGIVLFCQIMSALYEKKASEKKVSETVPPDIQFAVDLIRRPDGTTPKILALARVVVEEYLIDQRNKNLQQQGFLISSQERQVDDLHTTR